MTLIRRIRPDDWQKFKALRIEAVRLHPEAFSATLEQELSKTNDQWQARACECAQSKDNLIIVADNQCQLVGMVGLYRDSGKHLHVGHIWGVYVQADYRGQNLGYALMNEAIAAARKTDGLIKLTLQVNAINQLAHKVYRICGFQEVGRLHKEMNVVGQLCDLIVMELFL